MATYAFTVNGSATAYQALPDGTAVRWGDMIIGYTRGGISNGETFTFYGSGSSSTPCVASQIWLSGASVNGTPSVSNTGTFSVSCATPSHGSLSASPTSGGNGTVVTVTATPASGYKLSGVSTSPSATWTEANKKFKIPNADVTVSASFVVNSYSVTCNSGGNGTVSASPSSASPGTTITITTTPSSGYTLNSVSASPSVTWTQANKKFTMPSSNVTITATFKKVYTKVTAGNKIMATDRSQTGTTTTVGTVMTDSHFTAGTKVEASTFNSQVLA